jgi:hypothetical protein
VKEFTDYCKEIIEHYKEELARAKRGFVWFVLLSFYILYFVQNIMKSMLYFEVQLKYYKDQRWILRQMCESYFFIFYVILVLYLY